MSGRSGQRVVRRFPLFIVICAVVFVALYAVVVFLYAQGGKTDEGTAIDNRTPGLHVILTPREIDAAGDRIRFDMRFGEGSDSSSLVTSDGFTVMRDFQLLLSASTAGDGAIIDFEKGRQVAPTSVWLRTSGTIESWPFDRHPSETTVIVSASSAGGTESEAIPADITLGPHHVPGWGVTIHSEVEGVVDGTTMTINKYVIETHRATATIVFGIVLLALMVIMPVLGLTVAIMALRGKRRVEIGFFTWNAGMLFATPTLRNFLPGQPPVGSWVDYLVVLWVIAGLILSLLISVVAWYRWGKPQPGLPVVR
ncbi:cbb3-type cytochrome oxidase subunit 3 [Microbacterium resistens]|uniref:Cbb3-type cytochrome oxidase subunit 3 n=1 Tax=Microbacterium resistens TaxID=156977 RepID=A0ABU1S9Y0_9MICO|nr:DUF4436 family protein [Microbacterium resistens]MDR6866417.1 cbb3-type cytochrome oxidase subunit 3 [Microbacterium resistens]